jgi:prephenate dehydratase
VTAPATVSVPQTQRRSGASGATLRVAFQGELGAYGDQAIAQCWHGSATAAPSASFEDVVMDVAWGWVDYGIIPVWNTIVGDIESGRDAVRLGQSAAYGLVPVGETQVAVQHQLLALPGSTLDDIECVASHPVALAQCRRFLLAHPRMVARPVYDTAGAARNLVTREHGPAAAPEHTQQPAQQPAQQHARQRHTSAAIAGRAAAERYGLVILAQNIQDVASNVTRFIVLARAGQQLRGATTAIRGEPLRW